MVEAGGVVFIVFEYIPYEESLVRGVFSSIEKAEAFVKKTKASESGIVLEIEGVPLQ